MPMKNYEIRILSALRRIIRSVDMHSHKLRAQYDITSPQLITLLALINNGSLTMAGLAKEVHLTASTLVGIVDRLEAKGYAVRERDPKDRRQVFVSATEAGRAFAERVPAPMQQALTQALSELGELERTTIALALERIVELLEAENIDASPLLDTGKIIPTE